MDIWKQLEVSINMTSLENRKKKIGKPVFNSERTALSICMWGLIAVIFQLWRAVLERLNLLVWAQGIDLWTEVIRAKFCSILIISTILKGNTGSHSCRHAGRSWGITYEIAKEELSFWVEAIPAISESLFILQSQGHFSWTFRFL